MIGRTLSSYQILDKLGAGGMGEIYLAKDNRLGRRVALKVLPPELAERPQRLERFEREARALAALNHPNIVTIYSVEEAEGVRFFTMEVVDGEPLSQHVKSQHVKSQRVNGSQRSSGPQGTGEGLPLGAFLELAVPMVEAVRAAHERGIAHRDLKPANVMVSREGRVKVLDFGLAKLHATTPGAAPLTRLEGRGGPEREALPPDSQLTAAGQVFGTGPYMAPEQVRGEKVDQRSDLYSLGIVLFQVLTGRLCRRGETPPELAEPQDETASALAEREARIPERLRRVLVRCLDEDPDRRPSAAELHRELVDLKKEVEIQALLQEGEASGKISFPSTWRGHAAVSRRRAWRLYGPLLAILLLGLGALLLFWWTRGFWRPAPSWYPAERATPDAPETGTRETVTQKRPTLVVLPFQNLSGDLDWLRTGLADILVTDLSQLRSVEVVGTGRLHNVLKRRGLLEDPLIDSDTVRQVAKAAEADLVLSGSFVEAGGKLQISLKLQEAESGRILVADRREGLGEESVFALVDELSRSVRTRFVPAVGQPPEPKTRRRWQPGSGLTSSVEAYRYFSEGLALHRQSKDDAAISLLEKAVEIDPHFALALANLSTFHGNLGHALEAERYAKRAVEMGERLPANLRHYLAGRYHLRRWDSFPRAIEALERDVELYPDSAGSRSHLALLFLWLERYNEGIGLYEEQIARRKGVAITYGMMAFAHSALDRFDKAHQAIKTYLRRDSENWYAYMTLGWTLAHWEKFPEAEAAFARAEELRPGDLYVQNGRWRLYVLMEDWPRAAEQASAMIAAHDLYARWRGQVCAARTALYRGRAALALASFAAAADVYEDVGAFAALSHLWRAEIHLARGHEEHAIEEARAARRLAPQEWPELRGHFLEASALAALGRLAEAEAHYETLEKLANDFPNAVEARQLSHLAARLALARGDLEQARRKLTQAIALLPPRGIPTHWHALPDHVPLWYDVARLELAAGKPDAATRWLERVAASGVEHVEFPIRYVRGVFLLAEILEKSGDATAEARARELYERFLELWGDGELDRERVAAARAALGRL